MLLCEKKILEYVCLPLAKPENLAQSGKVTFDWVFGDTKDMYKWWLEGHLEKKEVEKNT